MIQCLFKVAALRLKYQRRCSQMLVCLNCLLLFIGSIWFIGGLVFVGMDVVSHMEESRLNTLMGAITAFLLIFFALILFVTCVGIKVSRFKAPTKCQVAAYGLASFVLLFIPFTAFSGGLLAISRVTEFDQRILCEDITDVRLGPKGLEITEGTMRRQKREKDLNDVKMRLGPSKEMIEEGIKMFQTMDMQMMMISQKMCSNVCPCSPKLVSDKTNMLQDVRTSYMNISELNLNQYGRTAKNKEGYIPLVFNGTYQTFMECVEHYMARVTDPNDDFAEYDMTQMFKIDFMPDKANENETSPNLFGDTAEAVQNSIGFDVFEFDAVSFVEEEFKCSGICSSALFYYGLSIMYGRPT